MVPKKKYRVSEGVISLIATCWVAYVAFRLRSYFLGLLKFESLWDITDIIVGVLGPACFYFNHYGSGVARDLSRSIRFLAGVFLWLQRRVDKMSAAVANFTASESSEPERGDSNKTLQTQTVPKSIWVACSLAALWFVGALSVSTLTKQTEVPNLPTAKLQPLPDLFEERWKVWPNECQACGDGGDIVSQPLEKTLPMWGRQPAWYEPVRLSVRRK